ncbi:MAG TPA: hypothetical protein VE172_03930 [Stackebrandtia sp.]|uniref:hypothetical protein n=1 Tax=Stackebrandtia sp. TaxID=2023065 RepID=UPI002D2FDEA5|nr:hypothetical protein [Stackebrandtia sp.]HZE37939.1 hypothetical protein [Stackebrandtia sp.]
MNSQAHGAGWTDRALSTLRLTPAVVTSIGLATGVAAPFVAKQGGVWIFTGAVLVAVTVLCDRAYPATTMLRGTASRRALVFVPLAARITEAAWLYGFWKLGTPAGVVIAAGAISFTHEYVRARGMIAGLRDIGLSTLGERTIRGLVALAGYGTAGAVALTSSKLSAGLATGIVTISATAWLLLGILGFVQLLVVMSAALKR